MDKLDELKKLAEAAQNAACTCGADPGLWLRNHLRDCEQICVRRDFIEWPEIMLKLIEMVDVLREGALDTQCDCNYTTHGHALDCYNRSARWALEDTAEIERSL